MRPSFTRSHETAKLLEFFKGVQFGRTVSFAELSKAVGFKVTSTLGAYHSARRIAERELSLVIESIRGVGFVRLVGEKISESGDRDILALRRSAKRKALRQEIAVSQNLDQAHMLRSTDLLNRFRMIADMATPAKSNRAIVETPQEEKPVNVTDRLRAIK